MLLHQLIEAFDPGVDLSAVANMPVTGVEEDSRLVKAGTVFVARPGGSTDGRKFIADAFARGAVAVVTEQRLPACALPQVVVGDARAAASVLAQIFFGSPSSAVKVLGVTGTNGKTTTTYLLRHLLAKVAKKCGVIGTVSIDDGKQQTEATMTTPSGVEVARLMAQMRTNGCAACAIEISSHALDQRRAAGIRFAGAAFTNLTGDHLDYHKTMEAYAAAKARLFESLDGTGVAVVNTEDAWSQRMIRDCKGRVIRFGFGDAADYRALDVSVTAQASSFVLRTPDGQTTVRMPLIGRHNIENALAAAALAGEAMGLTVHQIAAGLSDAMGAPGRLQAVRAGQPFAVLVDYAHTDDAMENVLTALRPLTGGKLRVLFGCGGDRDRTKRPRMARTAQRLADAIYVTSDNPRTEDPQQIINEILSGFSADSGKSLLVEPDRRSAIQAVLSESGPGDVVLLAGKGHENYQIIGTTRHHFDDVEEAMRVLQSAAAR